MASVKLSTITLPVFVTYLKNLSAILEKAERFAKDRDFDPNNFLAERLEVDQLPFVVQIRIISDTAKGTIARLVGIEAPKFADEETEFVQLKERIAKTLAFLESIKPEQIDGNEERPIPIYYMPGKYLPGAEYAIEYAMPNFFFHVTTAYSILRSNGVILGKADYMAGLNLRDE